MQVAQTILNQIGKQALMMIGAKQFVADRDSVRFRIGRNCKGWNMIQIHLNYADDLYRVSFFRIRSKNGVPMIAQTHTEFGIYFDQLHEVIERNTGMYTKLF